MSSPSDRDQGSDDFSLYAPRWAKGAPAGAPARKPQWPESTNPPEADEADGLVIERVRVPRSLEPGFVPEPPRERTRPARGWGLRVALACVAAGVIAYLAVVRVPDLLSSEAREQPPASPAFSSRFPIQGRTAEAAPPQFVAQPVPTKASGEAARLGLSLRGQADGYMVIVGGLPSGTTLSAGYPYGNGGWSVPAGELAEVQIYPPRGYVGAMDLGVELRQPNDVPSERRALRLEWTKPMDIAAAKPTPVETMLVKPVETVVIRPPEKAAAKPEAPKAAEKAAEPKPEAPARPRLIDRDELATLIRRGEEFLAAGDVSAARVTLKRAAEAQDGRAALTLASTFDPNVLEKLGVVGVKPDIALARLWYEKAREFGSADAPRRLEMLASRER